ncbi:hypothetical protein SteCoe_24489 [Stentor coeruleus]|uniref:Homologous-pairing protein 2 winged helix domain-containing protein n=1 Tax=Stentor coeruleus TaxID=5963 RepID=A0A1R2BHJ1_9CILI|nr:hypothetical protein SteCoe_24489 [Stentor coeruleus]
MARKKVKLDDSKDQDKKQPKKLKNQTPPRNKPKTKVQKNSLEENSESENPIIEKEPLETIETAKKFKNPNKKQIPKQNSPSTTDADLEEDHGLKGDEAVLFEFLLHQNRPYSLINIYDNLRGAIKKPQLQKTLDKLVEKKKVLVKEYGKVKIFLVNQMLIPELSEIELEELDTQISELNNEVEIGGNEVKDLQDRLKELKNGLSMEEIERQIEENRKVWSQLEMEIKDIECAGCVSVDIAKDIEGKLKTLQVEEKKRLRVWNELMTGMAEIFDVPTKKIKELIGIDVD